MSIIYGWFCWMESFCSVNKWIKINAFTHYSPERVEEEMNAELSWKIILQSKWKTENSGTMGISLLRWKKLFLCAIFIWILQIILIAFYFVKHAIVVQRPDSLPSPCSKHKICSLLRKRPGFMVLTANSL